MGSDAGSAGRLPNRRAMMTARSSNSEYATGTANSVSSSDKVWPPTITPLMALFTAAPSAFETKRGNHAGHEGHGGHQDRAEPVAVGLHDRLELGHPACAKLVGVVDLQNRVLLHHGEQHQDAQSEKMLIDWWKMNSDSSANGSVSGSESRMVIGWSHDSNWAAMQR